MRGAGARVAVRRARTRLRPGHRVDGHRGQRVSTAVTTVCAVQQVPPQQLRNWPRICCDVTENCSCIWNLASGPDAGRLRRGADACRVVGRMVVHLVVEEERVDPQLTFDTPGRVTCLRYLNGLLFAGLDDGRLAIYRRDQGEGCRGGGEGPPWPQ